MRLILFPNRRRRHPRLPKGLAKRIKPVADAHPDWSDQEVAREVKLDHNLVRYYRNPPKRRDVPRVPFIMQREGQPSPWIFRKPFRNIYEAHKGIRKLIAKLTRKAYTPPWYVGVFPPRGVDVEERDRLRTWAIVEWMGQQGDNPDEKKLFKERARQKALARQKGVDDPYLPGGDRQSLDPEGSLITPEEEWRALKFMSAFDVPADHVPPWVTEKILAFREAEPQAWLERMLEVEVIVNEIEARKHELTPAERETQESQMASLKRLLPLARQAAETSK